MNKINIAQFGSMAQAASACGIPLAVLRKAKREGCPAFVRDRVDIGDFIVWFFNQDNATTKEDYAYRHKAALAMTLEAKLEEIRDETCHVSLGRRFVNDLVGNIFFGQLERLSGEFPASLKGKTEIQINEEVIQQIAHIKRLLKDKLAEWDKKETRK